MARLQACLVATALLSSCDRRDLISNAADTATAAATAAAPNGLVYMCPMDKDVRSNGPGKCPRCGMPLTTTVPEPIEYHLELAVSPAARPATPVELRFAVFDPWQHNLVTRFSEVHEKLFHAFIVSRDLEFFVHDHPAWKDDAFYYDVKFPKPGMYRILGDFYPEASVPQLVTKTVFVAGEDTPPPALVRDYSPKQGENIGVQLQTLPEQPIAGIKTRLHFTISPSQGLEKYLGVWSHMLAASDDLIDMMHTHPFLADGGPNLYFNVIFPRPKVYRVWVQFLRNGVVNTVHFDVPVAPQVNEDVEPVS
jgi:hypothetical protein